MERAGPLFAPKDLDAAKPAQDSTCRLRTRVAGDSIDASGHGLNAIWLVPAGSQPTAWWTWVHRLSCPANERMHDEFVTTGGDRFCKEGLARPSREAPEQQGGVLRGCAHVRI